MNTFTIDASAKSSYCKSSEIRQIDMKIKCECIFSIINGQVNKVK